MNDISYNPDDWISQADAARELEMERQSFEAAALRRGYQSRKEGRSRLYLREDVVRYKAEREDRQKDTGK